MTKITPIKIRFMDKVSPEPMSGCWLWTASCIHNGYGRFIVEGKVKLAHRVSWEIHNGPIPKGEGYHGTCVLHKCDVRTCVNPDHLFLGTQKDNIRDMVAKSRRQDNKGTNHGRAKLTEKQVLEIFNATGTLKKIGNDYNIADSHVHQIKTGKNWGHLTGMNTNLARNDYG